MQEVAADSISRTAAGDLSQIVSAVYDIGHLGIWVVGCEILGARFQD